MARRADTPCAGGCGRLLWRGSTSLPAGQVTCRECRALTATPPAQPQPKPRTCQVCGTPVPSPAQACEQHKGLRRQTCKQCGQEHIDTPSRWFCRPCATARSKARASGRPVPSTAKLPTAHRRPRGRYRNSHRRRARRFGVAYEVIQPTKVFARDGWRCGICGGRVDRRLRHPHPRSASLDHIVPMSHGGAHVYVNVQCAHLECNVRKGAGSAGEQLALIG